MRTVWFYLMSLVPLSKNQFVDDPYTSKESSFCLAISDDAEWYLNNVHFISN